MKSSYFCKLTPTKIHILGESNLAQLLEQRTVIEYILWEQVTNVAPPILLVSIIR
jgi:hypothetical protein